MTEQEQRIEDKNYTIMAGSSTFDSSHTNSRIIASSNLNLDYTLIVLSACILVIHLILQPS